VQQVNTVKLVAVCLASNVSKTVRALQGGQWCWSAMMINVSEVRHRVHSRLHSFADSDSTVGLFAFHVKTRGDACKQLITKQNQAAAQ
jgi:hypothetical protein